ncbi:MAG: hypothetical protein N3F10_07510 [Candidatus Bathyarchaeota archaeon]|nr:hypothetical protein [Candidatus Bathyarchaeota archaeon]MCX8178118.1 hypothetical protein [Candidatus Bathyarchaeota archaeon]MDW8194486.1 hypothetical protein [Nitrososphaerota archaeon]
MSEDMIAEAIRIVEEATRRGLTLRIMGAVAVRIKCSRYEQLFNTLQRQLTDIDFVTYSKHGPKLCSLLRVLGYELRRDMLIHEGRFFFYKPDSRVKVDVFLDKLRMSHTIDFKNRLELDYPTIPLADLILEKLQIANITEKDLKDLAVLFRTYDVSNDDKAINSTYIARLLAEDWGFCYTVMGNLGNLRNFIARANMSEEDRNIILGKIARLSLAIEHEPKTLKWHLRSKIGTKIKWYTDVEEAER